MGSGFFVCQNLLALTAPKPSPLGKVAERSEVGRGLSRQPFGLPPSPKGRALRTKFQFIEYPSPT